MFLFLGQMNEAELQNVKEKVLQKAVDGLRNEGRKYVGKGWCLTC